MADAETIFTPWRKYGCVCVRGCACGCVGVGEAGIVCMYVSTQK